MRPPSVITMLAVVAAFAAARPAPAQSTPPATPPPPPATDDAPPRIVPVGPPADPASDTAPAPQTPAAPTSTDPIDILLAEVDRLTAELVELRTALAEARLEAASANRELAELRRFIDDSDRLGDDYEQYRNVRDIVDREDRERRREAMRERYEQQRAERLARMRSARAERDAQRAEEDRVASYARRGFAPLGLDVYIGKMAYAYHTVDATATRVDYVSGLGNYLRLYPGTAIDFSRMTISGSVLNASETTRNIGVAVAFFDEAGNQAGHEIIEVRNARPDVPYPFTATIQMALDRPFASSSQYVLYADEPAPAAAP